MVKWLIYSAVYFQARSNISLWLTLNHIRCTKRVSLERNASMDPFLSD